MTRVRLGAVGYLNARPLVYGLDRQPRFDLRYDVPSECATLLHAHAIDVGLIPSIEYLRGPRPYAIVPGPAVTSRGPVASVAIYTRVDPRDIRTIAMDTSSRTSVALAAVLARRVFGTSPEPVPMAPDLDAMLARADAALIIGDTALFLNPQSVHRISVIPLVISVITISGKSAGIFLQISNHFTIEISFIPEISGRINELKRESKSRSGTASRTLTKVNPPRSIPLRNSSLAIS